MGQLFVVAQGPVVAAKGLRGARNLAPRDSRAGCVPRQRMRWCAEAGRLQRSEITAHLTHGKADAGLKRGEKREEDVWRQHIAYNVGASIWASCVQLPESV
jgi:hypothetical protein